MQSVWWQLFDILGTAAFALSGALVAISRKMDIFGIYVLAAATAVGGGIVRDLLLGNIPPAAFHSSLYLWIIVLSVAAAFFGVRYINGPSHHFLVRRVLGVYTVCDAIGLGSFTVTGTLLGCHLYPSYWILNITLGVLTAVGGGVIRDVLAGRIPGVLKEDIYATASLIGAALLYGLYIPGRIPLDIAVVVSFSATVCLRLIALYFHWQLPHVRRNGGKTRW